MAGLLRLTALCNAGPGLLRSKAECGLTWAWSALMTAALPAACFISCTRPFAVLSGRLAKEA